MLIHQVQSSQQSCLSVNNCGRFIHTIGFAIVPMIKQLPGKTHTTGCNPNSAVANAKIVAKIAAASQWKKNQSIPPPPLPTASASASDRCNVLNNAAHQKQTAAGHQTTVGLRKKSIPCAASAGDQVSVLLRTVPRSAAPAEQSNNTHHAKGSAVSSDGPDFFHLQGKVTVVIVVKSSFYVCISLFLSSLQL